MSKDKDEHIIWKRTWKPRMGRKVKPVEPVKTMDDKATEEAVKAACTLLGLIHG